MFLLSFTKSVVHTILWTKHEFSLYLIIFLSRSERKKFRQIKCAGGSKLLERNNNNKNKKSTTPAAKQQIKGNGSINRELNEFHRRPILAHYNVVRKKKKKSAITINVENIVKSQIGRYNDFITADSLITEERVYWLNERNF